MEILISGAKVMATVLRHLLSTADGETAPAIFMHCTTGNNRTGIFISLLLLLLDVPTELIIREYTLSNAGLAPTKHVNVERLLRKGAFAEYGEAEAKRKCERMVGAREESMWALLEEVDRRWGGADKYFEGIVGLTSEEIERLKTVLTAEGDGDLSLETGSQLPSNQ
jgi:protein tyrosine/serine phosphatase